MVLYFYDDIWGVYFVTWGHACVPCVCIPLFLGRSSFQANVRGDGLVCCVFAEQWASWFMYWSHDVCILGVLCVDVLESFLCSWDVGRIRVVLSVDRASSRLLLVRC